MRIWWHSVVNFSMNSLVWLSLDWRFIFDTSRRLKVIHQCDVFMHQVALCRLILTVDWIRWSMRVIIFKIDKTFPSHRFIWSKKYRLHNVESVWRRPPLLFMLGLYASLLESSSRSRFRRSYLSSNSLVVNFHTVNHYFAWKTTTITWCGTCFFQRTF